MSMIKIVVVCSAFLFTFTSNGHSQEGVLSKGDVTEKNQSGNSCVLKGVEFAHGFPVGGRQCIDGTWSNPKAENQFCMHEDKLYSEGSYVVLGKVTQAGGGEVMVIQLCDEAGLWNPALGRQ